MLVFAGRWFGTVAKLARRRFVMSFLDGLLQSALVLRTFRVIVKFGPNLQLPQTAAAEAQHAAAHGNAWSALRKNPGVSSPVFTMIDAAAPDSIEQRAAAAAAVAAAQVLLRSPCQKTAVGGRGRSRGPASNSPIIEDTLSAAVGQRRRRPAERRPGLSIAGGHRRATRGPMPTAAASASSIWNRLILTSLAPQSR
jgi:hypothetical protein